MSSRVLTSMLLPFWVTFQLRDLGEIVRGDPTVGVQTISRYLPRSLVITRPPCRRRTARQSAPCGRGCYRTDAAGSRPHWDQSGGSPPRRKRPHRAPASLVL